MHSLHYTWTDQNGGLCWLKKGDITKSDAFPKYDKHALRGVTVDTNGIAWNGKKWANWCDFPGNDLTNVTTKSEDCYNRCVCVKFKACTHFTSTDYNGGTCWMKKGALIKIDAVPKYDERAVCGVTVEAHRFEALEWTSICPLL